MSFREGTTALLQDDVRSSARRRSLHVIQPTKPTEGNTLRSRSQFTKPLAWDDDRGDKTPRALRSLSKIIQGGLCHRCGSCVGICPTGVLAVDEEQYPAVKNLSACTDCDLCVKVCPGDEFDIRAAYREKFDVDVDLRSMHGEFSDAALSYATDSGIREHSTSGGLVTALLLDLLETGQIDGAAVITSDPQELWRGKAIVARSREELLVSMKSKYAITATNTTFEEIRNVPGRYALVGLPCQIHGFVKAAELDARLRERVVLTIGLFCHAAVEHDAYRIIWESIGPKAEKAVRFISRVGKHPGTPHVELTDGSLYPVYFGDKRGYRPSSMEIINIIYRLYTPSRCLSCFDASAEFADIAVGDPWMAPPHSGVDFQKGWSFALVRTPRGKAVYDAAASRGKVQHEDVTRREALACNKMMFTEKRWRAFRVIETLRRQGLPIPVYGPHTFHFPVQSGIQFVKTEIHMFTHVLCHLPRLRGPVLRFMLSNGGYILLWINRQRRSLRYLVRDSVVRARNAIFGRS